MDLSCETSRFFDSDHGVNHGTAFVIGVRTLGRTLPFNFSSCFSFFPFFCKDCKFCEHSFYIRLWKWILFLFQVIVNLLWFITNVIIEHKRSVSLLFKIVHCVYDIYISYIYIQKIMHHLNLVTNKINIMILDLIFL